MSPCGSTIGGGAVAAYGVTSGVSTLGGGVTLGAAAMLKIPSICFRDTIYLSPNVVGGLVGVGFRRAWVRSESACVSASFDDIIGNVSFAGEKSRLSENLSLDILGT